MKKYALIFLAFSFACSHPVSAPAFSPRVVKNGCGTFAVQISSLGRGADIVEGKITPVGDTIFMYLGVKTYHPVPCGLVSYDTVFSISGTGGSGIVTASGNVLSWVTDNCGTDTTTIAYAQKKQHEKMWSDVGDTSYDYRSPHEFQFKTEAEATAAMNSYNRRVASDKAFNDSITNCHTYK